MRRPWAALAILALACSWTWAGGSTGIVPKRRSRGREPFPRGAAGEQAARNAAYGIVELGPDADSRAVAGEVNKAVALSGGAPPGVPLTPFPAGPGRPAMAGEQVPSAAPPAAKAAAAAGTAAASTAEAVHNCSLPDVSATVRAVAARPGMNEAMHRACRHNTDWTFPDAVLDELRRSDRRWGYFCRRGRCNDPSHDVLAYYCGPGRAYEGADAVRGVDYIGSSCYDSPEDGDPRVSWSVLEPGPVGRPGWTGRGRF